MCTSKRENKNRQRWEKIIPKLQHVGKEFWKNLYKIPHETVRDGRVSIMQYEILHYTINCTEKLLKWKIEQSALCNLKDDIIHFFISCKKCIFLAFLY